MKKLIIAILMIVSVGAITLSPKSAEALRLEYCNQSWPSDATGAANAGYTNTNTNITPDGIYMTYTRSCYIVYGCAPTCFYQQVLQNHVYFYPAP